jgi:lactoylglutathione lyase
MKYLHTLLRVSDIESSPEFCCDAPGLVEPHRIDNEKGRFTRLFPAAPGYEDAQIELT